MIIKRLTNLLGLVAREKPKVGQTPFDVVWAENKWRLLRYRARPQGVAFQTPLLLVPSLINRHYVLDLMPGKSFVEWLVAQGHDVFCIDWGTPGDEDRYVTFDDVVDRTLGRAIRIAARHGSTGKTHLLGYCMGGLLTAIHGAVHPDQIASMVTLAAPVKFDDGGLLSTWTRLKTFDVDALIEGAGLVPWQLLQSAFHLLRPTLPLQKAVSMLDRAWNDEFLDGFLALETWGNDNVALPGEFYRTYIKQLYRSNDLLDGEFRLSGRRVDLQNLRCPLLTVSFANDHIVPNAAATPLSERAGSLDKQHLVMPGGHVGAVVSKHAAKSLWPNISTFFAERDGARADFTPADVTMQTH